MKCPTLSALQYVLKKSEDRVPIVKISDSVVQLINGCVKLRLAPIESHLFN